VFGADLFTIRGEVDLENGHSRAEAGGPVALVETHGPVAFPPVVHLPIEFGADVVALLPSPVAVADVANVEGKVRIKYPEDRQVELRSKIKTALKFGGLARVRVEEMEVLLKAVVDDVPGDERESRPEPAALLGVRSPEGTEIGVEGQAFVGVS